MINIFFNLPSILSKFTSASPPVLLFNGCSGSSSEPSPFYHPPTTTPPSPRCLRFATLSLGSTELGKVSKKFKKSRMLPMVKALKSYRFTRFWRWWRKKTHWGSEEAQQKKGGESRVRPPTCCWNWQGEVPHPSVNLPELSRTTSTMTWTLQKVC